MKTLNEKFGLSKKNFSAIKFLLNWKDSPQFSGHRMIELGCKSFMPIQTLDLHRVAIALSNKPLEIVKKFSPLNSDQKQGIIMEDMD